ncbi:hypothetical protein ACSSS7_006770 [Eimeria intestinalis]
MEPFGTEFPRGAKLKHAVAGLILLAALGLYVYGTCAPAIRITGQNPGFLDIPVKTQEFSLIDLLRLLRHQQNYVPFISTLVFSFFLPVVKFTLIIFTLIVAVCCRGHAYSVWLPLRVIRILVVVCKYQLVDAFSVILLVTFINYVGVEVEPLLASQAYLLYCLLAIINTQWLSHCYLETWKRNTWRGGHRRLLQSLTSPAPADLLSLPKESACKRRQLAAPLLPQATAADESLLGSSSGEEQSHSKKREVTSLSSFAFRRRRGSSPSSAHPHDSCVSIGSLTPPIAALQPLDEAVDPIEPHESAWIDVSSARRGSRICGGAIFSLLGRLLQRPFSCLSSMRHGACRTVFCCSWRAAHRSPSILSEHDMHIGEVTGGGGADTTSAAAIAKARCLESVLRVTFLVLLFLISCFSLLVCWVRPVLEVALVPGQERAFAIDVSSRSLQEVFSRLYTMGHLFTGCGMLFVFPLLATCIVYLSSMGAEGGAAILQWQLAKRAAAAGPAEGPPPPLLRRESGGGPLQRWGAPWFRRRRRLLETTQLLSRVSEWVGDIAAPDAQSIGLLTSFFIMNNLDFFAARLPPAPLTPLETSPGTATTLQRLFSNHSGFLALVAFGVASSQVHRLVEPFEQLLLDLQEGEERLREEAAQLPYPGGGTEELQLPVEEQKGPISQEGAFPCSSLEAPLLVRRRIASPFSPPSPLHSSGDSDEKKRRKTRFVAICLHGGIRLALAVLLLLPIWQRPPEVVDLDLPAVALVLYANPLLPKVLPQSYGDCLSEDTPAPAPPPCFGSAPLVVVRTSAYEAKGRWATGLKKTKLQDVFFEAAPHNRILLKITWAINSLTLSLRIGQCIYGEGTGECPVLWDGTDACCGEGDTSFSIVLGATCGGTAPYLSELSLLEVHVSRLVVTEKILGIIPVEVADITQMVEDQVARLVDLRLDPRNTWIRWTHGEELSAIQLLNQILRLNAPAGLRCPQPP